MTADGEGKMINKIRENIEKIIDQIAEAADRSGRKAEEIRLMAVSKTRLKEEVEAAYQAGIRLFGENRVLEAQSKFEDFHEDGELHIIGHLQSNKAKYVVKIASCVQSIDKIKTALVLNDKLISAGRSMDILLEVNTSGEESKSGFRSSDEMYRTIDEILSLEKLTIRGLMTMAPFTREEAPVRHSFRSLHELFQKTSERYPELHMDILSMGMSSDFKIAIEEGSTLVRIGTALFGARV